MCRLLLESADMIERLLFVGDLYHAERARADRAEANLKVSLELRKQQATELADARAERDIQQSYADEYEARIVAALDYIGGPHLTGRPLPEHIVAILRGES
jgi:hypothetical protein